jgi:hypothetical protein
MGWLSDTLVANGIALREAVPLASYLHDPDLNLPVDAAGNKATAYRQLSRGAANRDLTPLDQDRHIEIAVYFAEANPLARAVICLKESIVLGEGLVLKSQRDDCQEVLDEFWDDPDNNFSINQYQRFRQLRIFGELILPAFVTPEDGHVKLGYIDPANVKMVRTNPMNAEQRLEVVLKTAGGVELPPIPIIRLDERRDSRTKDFLIGGRAAGSLETGAVGTFYFCVNNLSNAARGRSDLLCMFDWLDSYDQFLFGAAERGIHQGDHIWDVTMEGASEQQQREWALNNPIPQGSGMRVHNEKVTIEAVAPKLEAGETFQQARTLRQQVAMPELIPEGWLFNASDSNRSTLREQSEPTYRYFSKVQKEYKSMLAVMGRFAIDQACLAGRLPRNLTPEERWVEVEGSEVSTKDLSQVATMMKDTSAHLLVAEGRWITRQEASEIYRRGLAEYGVEIDPDVPEIVAPDDGVDPYAQQAVTPSADTTRQTARRGRAQARGNGRNGRSAASTTQG